MENIAEEVKIKEVNTDEVKIEEVKIIEVKIEQVKESSIMKKFFNKYIISDIFCCYNPYIKLSPNENTQNK